MNIFISFWTFKPRSSIHCSTMCIKTTGCSAFSFDEDSGFCGLGTIFNLKPPAAGANTINVFVNADGKSSNKGQRKFNFLVKKVDRISSDA